MSATPAEQLLQQLKYPGANIVFLTGAGISVASGIPPFRGSDPDAVWNKDVLEKGTYFYFTQDPVGSWAWFLERFDKCREAEPNDAHKALIDIEQWLVMRTGKRCTVVTQNIDGLHKKAGTANLIECHGTARHMRCVNGYCKHGGKTGTLDWDENLLKNFRKTPTFSTLPRCPACAALLRPHVLLFDESYSDHESFGFERFNELMDGMTCLVFVGTSFAVSVTDLLMTSAYQAAVPMFNIDPCAKEVEGITLIKAPAEIHLPALFGCLPR